MRAHHLYLNRQRRLHPFVQQVAHVLETLGQLDWTSNWREQIDGQLHVDHDLNAAGSRTIATDGSIDGIVNAITAGNRLSDECISAVPEIESEGWEALAWYVPLHQRGPHAWGFYFHGPRMSSYAECMAASLSESGLLAVLKLATQAILHHERFHFFVEYYATQAEQNLLRPVYVPYKEKVYTPSWGGPTCIEESLANAYALTRRYNTVELDRTSSKALKQYLRHSCDNSPGGYREYDRYLRAKPGTPRTTEQRFRGYCGLLAEIIRDASLPDLPFEHWLPVVGNRFDLASDMSRRLLNQIPTYVVRN
jgi:hypothetical protein